MITNKKRSLLYLIHNLKKRDILSKTMIIKNLFIIKKENNIDNIIKFYNFYPYKYGPFSNTIYQDIDSLISNGLLKKKDDLTLTRKGIEESNKTDTRVKIVIEQTMSRFNNRRSITNYVYNNYKDYTVKSKLIEKNAMKKEPHIFTIGYESMDIDSFLDTMIKNDINTVIDVRRNPFSMNFNFTGKPLKKQLESVDIEYVQIPELGIDGEMRKNLSTPEDYNKLFNIYRKGLSTHKDLIDRIISLGKKNRIVILCFEKDEEFCHRGIISKLIESRGINVNHL